jgi:hypothetical protein
MALKNNVLGTKIVTSRRKIAQPCTQLCKSSSQSIGNQSIKKSYRYLSRHSNPNFDNGVKILPLRSCLIHDNSAVFRAKEIHVKTEPKWFTDLWCDIVQMNSGEIIGSEIYTTNEIKSSNARKIKRLDAFCSHFQPLYERKDISMLFFTLTLANQSKMTISGIVDVIKKRCKRRGITFHGYIWTSEISETLHWHYHLAVSIDRINIRGIGIPTWLKLESVWGARTQIEFVRKNIRHYMAKYFAKENARIIGARSFGCYIKKHKNK